MHYSSTSTRSRPQLAAEINGAWDASPLAEMASAVEALEAAKRRTLDAFRDVAAWSGTAQTTGLTQSEWLTLVGRLSSRDAGRLERMTSRLSALPVTASLLAAGEITVEQAAQICDGTTRLSGTKLAEVDRLAAHAAAARNVRGDTPDIDVEVDRLVEERRKPRDVEAAERRAVDGSRVTVQQGMDGGGLVVADLAAVEFSTVVAAIEDAAGTPDREIPRRRQRAAGLVAMSDHWLTGPAGPLDGDTDGAAGDDTPVRRGAARAKPNITLTVDLADATPSTFAQVWRTAAGRHAPYLTARMTDVLSCDTDLNVLLTDGAQPLIELKDRDRMPAAVRRAILTRDKGCRFPGCTAPPWQCDVHHIEHRADGGDHSVDNGMGARRPHHMRLHGPHWTIRLDPATGVITFSRRRDGTRPAHTTFPHGTHPAKSGAPPGVAAPR